MLQQFDFHLTQTRYIKSAADLIPSFRPDGLDPAAIQAKVTAAKGVRGIFVTQFTAITGARADRRLLIEALHDGCVDFTDQARSRYRKNRNVLERMDRLPIQDKTFKETMERADLIVALWDGLPQVGAPPAGFTFGQDTVDVTLAAFTQKRDAAQAADDAIPPADDLFQKAEGDKRTMQEELEDFAQAAITQGRRYAEGSTERNIIDAIPTEFPRNAPGKATIIATNPQNADVHLEVNAPSATSFDVFQRLEGETDWTLIADDIIEKTFDLIVPAAGTYEFKAVGRNARGTGPESDVASLPVTP